MATRGAAYRPPCPTPGVRPPCSFPSTPAGAHLPIDLGAPWAPRGSAGTRAADGEGLFLRMVPRQPGGPHT